MSADNYAICPKCLKSLLTENTLREYFDIGILKDGEFCISYDCHCNDCDFKFKYEYSEQIKL